MLGSVQLVFSQTMYKGHNLRSKTYVGIVLRQILSVARQRHNKGMPVVLVIY